MRFTLLNERINKQIATSFEIELAKGMDYEAQSGDEQGWFTIGIVVEQELLAKAERLKNSFQAAQKAHIQDLMNAAIQRARTAAAEVAQLKTETKALHQKLWSTSTELQACYQELQQTNQELAQALNSDRIPYSEAIAVAKEIVAEDELVKNALVRLLQAIYGQKVNSQDLAQPYRVLAATPHSPHSAKFCALSAQAVKNEQLHKAAIARSLQLVTQAQKLLAASHKSRTLNLHGEETQ